MAVVNMGYRHPLIGEVRLQAALLAIAAKGEQLLNGVS